jgi:hypothetical protein
MRRLGYEWNGKGIREKGGKDKGVEGTEERKNG